MLADNLCKRSKEKGILIHLFADAQGIPLSAFSAPANEDERKHVEKLLDIVEVKTGKIGQPRKKVKRLAADKDMIQMR